MFEAALEAGASSCESSDEIHEIFCEPDELSNVREILVAKYGEPEQCRLSWRGINNIMIDDVEKAQKIIKLVDLLEDSDDVQFVYGNYIFADSIMDKINL
jgi:transcriptional/translational regulatory protein YebC/TACO1